MIEVKFKKLGQRSQRSRGAWSGSSAGKQVVAKITYDEPSDMYLVNEDGGVVRSDETESKHTLEYPENFKRINYKPQYVIQWNLWDEVFALVFTKIKDPKTVIKVVKLPKAYKL